MQALFKEHPEHLYNNLSKGSKVVLPNGFSGKREKDFREADKINKKYNFIDKRPENYTWEHNRDKKTLYLVKSDVHGSTPHTGGHSLAMADIKKSGYKLKADNKIKTKNGNGITTKCHGKGKPMS